ncbi:MAG: hypothetical protein HKM06_00495, partial [Spirochaetales bacterium]|nr:hypothetical protein [Spirochaetales bacterium]
MKSLLGSLILFLAILTGCSNPASLSSSVPSSASPVNRSVAMGNFTGDGVVLDMWQ